MKLTVFALLLIGAALAALTVVFRSGMQQFELDPRPQNVRPPSSLATVPASASEKPTHPWLKKPHRTAYSAARPSAAEANATDVPPAAGETALEEPVLEESFVEESATDIQEAEADTIALQTWVEELGQRELALIAAEEQWQAQQEQALKDQEAWLSQQPDTPQTREAFAELVKVWEAAATEHEAFLATQREQIEADLTWLQEQEGLPLEAASTGN